MFNNLFLGNPSKILVIGDIMLDSYITGNTTRISPEAPVPVVNYNYEENMLGGAGNVLKNLISLGVDCDLISIIGNDITGLKVINLLKDLTVTPNFIFIDDKRITTEKIRIISNTQQMLRLDKEVTTEISKEFENKIIFLVNKIIIEYDIIIISDYLKGLLSHRLTQEIINICNKNNKIILVDPKGSDLLKYENSTIIKLNLKESEIFLNKKVEEIEDVFSALFELKKISKSQNVIITLSERGLAFLDKTPFHIPTKVTNICDVSGAGDTVIAALAFCLSKGYNLYEACKFANTAASIVIQKMGSVTTNINEVLNNIYE